MCFLLYLATLTPQKILDNKNNQSFYISEVADNHPVRTQFQEPYVYQLHSYEGCGCCFTHDEYMVDREVWYRLDNEDDPEEAIESIKKMNQFILDLIQSHPISLLLIDGDIEDNLQHLDKTLGKEIEGLFKIPHKVVWTIHRDSGKGRGTGNGRKIHLQF